MRRLLFYILILSFVIGNSSCGPSEAEIQQKIEDRIRVAKQLQESIQTANQEFQSLSQKLSDTKAELEVARDGMNNIKEWKLGRLPKERDQQIRAQSVLIQNIENAIVSLEKSVEEKAQEVQNLSIEFQAIDVPTN